MTSVSRERGSRSAAAVAARIERGYLKRIRTAGSTVCVNNHVESRGTGTDCKCRPAAERTSTTARDGDDDTRTRKRKTRTASAEHDRHARTARAGRSGRHTGVWQARPVRRGSDEVRGWVVQTEIVPRPVDHRYQQELTTTEASSIPRLNATLGSEESALSTQMYHILVMTTAGAVLDNCHNAGVNEGLEAWRQFVMEWEPKLRTRYVVLMNVLVYRFRDDIPTKLAAFERTVHDCENQSTKTVDDDIKIGVTMLGMEAMRVKEHLVQNSVRITSWNQMREEILEITRTQQHFGCHCSSERIRRAKARAQTAKAKGKGKDVKGKDKAKDAKNESSKKAKSDDLLLQQDRSREGRVCKDNTSKDPSSRCEICKNLGYRLS